MIRALKRCFRKIRGILSIGTLWGLVGGALGTASGFIALLFGLPALPTLAIAGLGGVALGFVIGSGFAGILSLLDGRRSLHQLSMARSALWGGFAGILSMLVMTIMGGGPEPLSNFLLASGVFGSLGAGMAAGTVRLARRSAQQLPGATLDDSELSLASDSLANDRMLDLP